MQFHVLNFLPVLASYYWFFPQSGKNTFCHIFAMAKTQPCFHAISLSFGFGYRASSSYSRSVWNCSLYASYWQHAISNTLKSAVSEGDTTYHQYLYECTYVSWQCQEKNLASLCLRNLSLRVCSPQHKACLFYFQHLFQFYRYNVLQ